MDILNNPIYTFLLYSLLGAIYFLLYRYLCFKTFKWKMIHSIWIPIIYGIAYTTYGIMLLQTPWFGANRTFLSQLTVISEMTAPVIVFFAMYFFFAIKAKKGK
jgi:hypothetical protein